MSDPHPDLLRPLKWGSGFLTPVRDIARTDSSAQEEVSNEESLHDVEEEEDEFNVKNEPDGSGDTHSNSLSDQQAIYRPLPQGTIRLLHLHPGRHDEDVRCELVIASLDAEPRYEAVSYWWGYSFDRLKISLNGTSFWIGQNLAECLQNIRHHDRPRVLWVDALCINQADSAEKGVQIEVMAQIYQSASRTLIWLGNDQSCNFDYLYVDAPNGY